MPEIPADFYCPLTKEIMEEPVIAADGCIYERWAIEQWIAKKGTSPKDLKKVLAGTEIITLTDKQGEIYSYLKAYEALYGEIGAAISIPKTLLKKLIYERLIKAIESNELTKVKQLIERDEKLLTTNLTPKTSKETYVFYLASQYGSLELTNYLLEQLIVTKRLNEQLLLSKPANFEPTYLNILLHQALWNKNFEKSSLLLELRANLEQQDEALNTLLHKMVLLDNREAVEWIANKASNLLMVFNAKGDTPLSLAKSLHHEELVAFLTKKQPLEGRLLSRPKPAAIPSPETYTDPKEEKIKELQQRITTANEGLARLEETRRRKQQGFLPFFSRQGLEFLALSSTVIGATAIVQYQRNSIANQEALIKDLNTKLTIQNATLYDCGKTLEEEKVFTREKIKQLETLVAKLKVG